MNFDEMMKKYITILKHTGLQSHQMFIKSIPMMKGERRSGRPRLTTQMMNFSFDEYFDERMMNVHCTVIQRGGVRIHRIIIFSFITKSTIRL